MRTMSLLRCCGATAKKSRIDPYHDDDEDKPKRRLKPVSIFRLWAYTNASERMILGLGVLATVGAGSMIPYLETFLGQAANSLIRVKGLNRPECFANNGTRVEQEIEQEKIYEELDGLYWKILLFGGGHFIFSYTYVAAFHYAAEKQAFRLKSLYLTALFRQELEWRDKHFADQDTNFVSTFLEDIGRVQEATGEKIALLLYIIFTSVISGILSLVYATRLAIIIGSSAPLMLAVSGIVYRTAGRMAVEEEAAFGRVNAMSTEALVNIRAVYAYGGQKTEVKQHCRMTDKSLKLVRKRIWVEAIGSGLLWFINFATFALAFWQGTDLVIYDDGLCKIVREEAKFTVEDLIGAFKIVNGIFEICQYFAYIDVLSDGRTAAAHIFEVCQRQPVIDPYSNEGLKPAAPLEGQIEFRNVSFVYPSGSSQTAIRNVNLNIQPGVYCIVGPAGCGKSTLMNLLLRFYDPTEGQILFDGVDVKDYNLGWLRSQIGIITQDPVIFSGTVADNVRYGKANATIQEIVEACENSFAHEFVSKLPKGYDTVIGRGGIELSVYQKQRIAIARAVIRKPVILLFDEATKALETKNQSRWHRRLIESRKGLTTIIVAHLFPTLNLADYIISLKDGQVDELGTNEELLKNGQNYARLYAGLKGQEDVELNGRKSAAEVVLGKKSVATMTTFTKDASVHALQSDWSLLELESGKQAERDSVAQNIQQENVWGGTTTSSPFWRLLRLANSQYHLIFMGFLMSALLGLTCPTYALLLGAVMSTIGEKSEQAALTEVREYTLTIFILGFTAAFTTASQSYCLTWASSQIIFRLRKLLFSSLLHQDIAAFDTPQMNPRTLFSRISSEIGIVNSALGSRLSLVVQAISTLGMTIGIAFQLHPVLGFCVLPLVPVIGSVAVISTILSKNQVEREKRADDEVSVAVFEAYSHYTTIALLGREQEVVASFVQNLARSHRFARRLAHLFGLLHGLSQSSFYFAYASVVFFGTRLLRKNEIKFNDIFVLGEALIWCTLALGNALAYSFNCGKAQVAAKRVFQLLDRRPHMQSGSQVPSRDISKSSIEFDQVDFSFPLRPGLRLLDKCNLRIYPYENLGIVGSVDCGKSAIIPLLLRLYDVNEGSIKINGVDIREWNLKALRSQISAIFSEPMLFNRTIAENIAYGDNSRTVVVSEVVQAAKHAKLHDFIQSLPEGYNFVIGPDGQLLSQRHRHALAFARAVLKTPSLLLIEETFRDYDNDSTNLIEEYLNGHGRYMTVVSTAAELKAVKSFDRIVVLHVGHEKESGTHDELIMRNGIYRKLWDLQHIGFHL